MCGRFTLTSPGEVLAEFFELVDVPRVTPRYNIAPTQPAPVVRVDREAEARRLDLLHWGLIPSWAKDPGIGSRMINARAETVADKPAFRSALRYRRCLVAADGFYEWKKIEGQKRKQPYYIHMADRLPFAFAGLWEHWESADEAEIDSCTIITTEPNKLMESLHNRMPVILQPKDFDMWLDPDLQESDSLQLLLVPCPAEGMTFWPVSTVVNSPANDTPACTEPLEQ